MSLAKLEAQTYHEANTGCWLWGGAVSKSGYGATSVGHGRDRKQVSAHRLSWSLHNGCEPPKGMFVCHKCDTPVCVNPAHLFLGTPKENTRDMMAKGRRVAPSTANRPRGDDHPSRKKPECLRRGMDHPGTKLTDDDVLSIRASVAMGVELARKYGVSSNTISRIRKRLIWSHI